MSNFDNLDQLMNGHNPHQELLQQTRKLVDKWEPTGLLDDMTDSTKKTGMAVLLENQATQLIKEASGTGTGGSREEWSGVALPLVRRIFGEISAQEFVSVQPMNLPSGLIFYLDFKYGSANQANHAQNTDVFGVTSGSGDPNQGLYGAGKSGYSINDKVTAIQISGSAVANGVFSLTHPTWKELEFEPSLSASLSAGNLSKLTVDSDAFTRPDTEGVKAWEVSGSFIDAIYPQYTTIAANGDVSFIVQHGEAYTADDDIAMVNTTATASVLYHQQPTATQRGDFEQSSFTVPGPAAADDLQIPEVDIQLRSIPIVAKTRKLKAVWTPELAQDLNAYHSIDAEAELTSMLSEYISMEIDLEIIDMLLNDAVTTSKWSAKVGFEWDGSNFAQISGTSNAYTKKDWYETLGVTIQDVSNKIHQLTLRGGANFLVCSPQVATIIESIPGYAVSTDGQSSNFAMGVAQVGSLQNRWTVYKNPYMVDNTILVGFRGSNFLETGAVYAPYVPLIMTPLVYDPDNFTPRKGVMTRYAKKMVRPEFYGKIFINGLENVAATATS